MVATSNLIPFNGAWNAPPLTEEDGPPPWTKRHKRRLRKGGKHYRLYARIEPEGDLYTFGRALGASLERIIDDPGPDDHSVIAVFDCVTSSPMEALSATAFRFNRRIKKVGMPVVRVTWDVIEMPR